ncbi:MAG: sulfatase-like hydrolase/transferase [Candidatus Tritonobacter lacicola]|nr:sulfatase-like hydrolase/transferase [Candidatus Tritonobacter lacicola]
MKISLKVFLTNAVGALILIWMIDFSFLIYRNPDLSGCSGSFSVLLLQSFSVFVLTGCLLGVTEFFLCRLSHGAAHILAGAGRRAGTEKRVLTLQAAILTAILSPIIGYVSYRLFHGAGISRSQIATAGPYLTGFILAFSAFFALRFILAEADKSRRRIELSGMKRVWILILSGGLILFFYWVDACIYVRLYGYIHNVLTSLAVASSQIFLAGLLCRRGRRILGAACFPFEKWRAPLSILVVIVLFLIAANFSNRYPVVRHAVFEKMVVESKFLALLSRVKLYPRPTAVEADTEKARLLWKARKYNASSFHGIAKGMNVLLITVDTLRADHIGKYGDREARTPVIDALGEGGLDCLWNFVQSSPGTSYSVATILTSDYIEDAFKEPEPWTRSLTSILRENGYITIQASPPDWDFSMSSSISSDFMIYAYKSYAESVAEGFWDDMSTEYVTRAVSEDFGKPFFIWVHLMSPHARFRGVVPGTELLDYKAGEESVDADRVNYRKGITYADRCIGRMLEALREKGIQDSTMVVVTADHGDGFGEHGFRYHPYSAYNELTRTPLIISIPGIEGTTISKPSGTLDIGPTILDAVGITPPATFLGRSLLSQVAGDLVSGQDYVLCRIKGIDALIYDGFKLIRNRQEDTYELYHLQEDPEERINLASVENRRVVELSGLLEGLLEELKIHRQDMVNLWEGKIGGGERQDSMEDILDALNSPSMEARRKAICKLGEIGDRGATPLLLDELGDGRPTAIRVAAIQSLARLRDPRAFPKMEKILEGGEPVLRREAIQALAESGEERSAEALVKLLAHEKDYRTLGLLYKALLALNRPETVRPLIDYWIELDEALRAKENIRLDEERGEARRWVYNEVLRSFYHHGDEKTLRMIREWEKETDNADTWKNLWLLLLSLKDKGSLGREMGRVTYIDNWSIWREGGGIPAPAAAPPVSRDGRNLKERTPRRPRDGRWERAGTAPPGLYVPVPIVELVEEFKDVAAPTTAKLKANILSPQPQTCRMIFFSSGDLKLWCNQEIMFEQPYPYLDGRYADCIELKLKKGLNKIVVETRCSHPRALWGFGAALVFPPHSEPAVIPDSRADSPGQ